MLAQNSHPFFEGLAGATPESVEQFGGVLSWQPLRLSPRITNERMKTLLARCLKKDARKRADILEVIELMGVSSGLHPRTGPFALLRTLEELSGAVWNLRFSEDEAVSSPGPAAARPRSSTPPPASNCRPCEPVLRERGLLLL